MLNFEQLLIKTAQYLDFDLNKLEIKQTLQKRRFFTKDETKKTYDEVLQNLLKEIHYFNVHPILKQILYEFLDDYDYVQRELYTTFGSNLEKKYDWLLLKYFVVPYFAYLLAYHFSKYDSRIDKGLPGGEFWYLPKTGEKKILFPLNMLLKWWIDLYGTTNEDFYWAIPLESSEQKTSSENISADMDQRRNLLKSWHDKFVIPDMSSIHKYVNEQLDYRGLFIRDTHEPLEKQFEDAYHFVNDKKQLTLDDLKREFPNPDNLLDRLEDNLSSSEQEKFISYIQERWKEPTPKQLTSLLTFIRIIQSVYKDLSKYFESDMDSTDISQNKIMQLCGLFSNLHNYALEFFYSDSEEDLNKYAFFTPYLKSFFYCSFSQNKKELLDSIISTIATEVGQDNFQFSVDEILLYSQDKEQINQEIMQRLSKKYARAKADEASEKQMRTVLKNILENNDESFVDQQIKSLDHFDSLINLGQCFEGHNHLTNEVIFSDFHIALKAYYHAFDIACSEFERSYTSLAIINLATFPLWHRLLTKEEVDFWFEQCPNCETMDDGRDYLILITRKAFHQILQKKYQNAIPFVVEFMNKTKSLKDNEYNPELLCIGERIAKLVKNRKLETELKKRNTHHELCKIYHDPIFYY